MAGLTFWYFVQIDIHVFPEAADVELPLALVTQNDCEICEAIPLEILLVTQHAAPQHVFLDNLTPA